jgi:hypothetical protein
VGWVSGPTLASTGEAVSGAVVEGGGLPFIGRTGVGVPYLLPVRPGTAQLNATVPGQRLVGSGSVTVAAGGPGEAASLPIALTGEATLATVTPADGSLGVAVSVQVELEATGPLDPSAVNLAKAKLLKGAELVAVKYWPWASSWPNLLRVKDRLIPGEGPLRGALRRPPRLWAVLQVSRRRQDRQALDVPGPSLPPGSRGLLVLEAAL